MCSDSMHKDDLNNALSIIIYCYLIIYYLTTEINKVSKYIIKP